MTTDASAPRLVTVKTAAARFERVSVRMILRLIGSGLLPAVRPPGTRGYLVAIDDVDRVFTPTLKSRPEVTARETPTERELQQLRQAGIVVGSGT